MNKCDAGTLQCLNTSKKLLALHVVLPVLQVSKKPAAVLVPLFEDAEGCVRCVLTLRSSRLKSHSGGRREPCLCESHT